MNEETFIASDGLNILFRRGGHRRRLAEWSSSFPGLNSHSGYYAWVAEQLNG